MRLPLHGRILVMAASARLVPEGLALSLVLWSAAAGDPVVAGVLIAVATFPQLVTGPLLGTCLDRARRPDAVVAVAAAVAAAGCAVLAVSGLRLAVAVPGALALSLSTPVLTGGLSSVIAGWGDGTSVAAWDSAGYNVAGLAAPVLVTLVAAVEPALALAALGIGALVTIPAVVFGPRTPPPERSRRAGRVRLRDALAAIGASRRLLGVTVATTMLSAGLGGLEIALGAATTARGQPVERVGVLVTAIAVGALVGSLAMTRLRRPLDPSRTAIAAVAASGLLVAGMAAAGWPAMVLVAFGVGLVDAPLLVGTYRTRSDEAPVDVRASVFTVGASLKLGAGSIGALAVTAIVDGRATGLGLLVIGVLGCVAALVGATLRRGSIADASPSA